jgi:hypothetical protein
MPLFANANAIIGSLSVSNGVTATTGNIAAVTGNVTAGGAVSATGLATGGTGVTATTGDITATTGNLVASAGGKGLRLNDVGAAAKVGAAALVNGHKTVVTTGYASGSYVFMTYGTAGTGTREPVHLGDYTPGTSFDIEGGGIANDAVVYWWIIN